MVRERRRNSGLERVLDVLGLLFLGLCAASIFLVGVLVVHFGDHDTTFPFGQSARSSVGFLKSTKVLGIGIFVTLAIASWGVADMLLEHPHRRVRRWWRARRRDAAR